MVLQVFGSAGCQTIFNMFFGVFVVCFLAVLCGCKGVANEYCQTISQRWCRHIVGVVYYTIVQFLALLLGLGQPIILAKHCKWRDQLCVLSSGLTNPCSLPSTLCFGEMPITMISNLSLQTQVDFCEITWLWELAFCCCCRCF